MTDKQIIIDVTQCPYYKEDKTCTYLPYKSKCEGDCNWTAYKEMEEQLKRAEAQCEAMFVSHTDLEKKYKDKEQECEELNNIINEAKNSKLDLNSFFAIEATVGEYQLELDQLKAENDELKKLLKVRIEDLCDSCGASSMMLMPCKVYEKTLTEIKEIAEHCIKQDICTFCDYSDRCYIEDEEIPTYDVCKLILQKISECEGNND